MPLVDKIKGNIPIDSLSYIDKEVLNYYKQYNSKEMQDLVDELIQDEMKTFNPQNYLDDLPLPELNFANSEILKVYILLFRMNLIELQVVKR